MAGPALIATLVLGLTLGPASAAPPDPDPDPVTEQLRVGAPIVVGSVALASLTTAIVFTTRSALASRSLAADLAARRQYDQHDPRLVQGRRDALVAASMFATTAVVSVLVVVALRPVARARARRSSSGATLGWTVRF